jgi:hypothetical protein
MCSTEIGNKYTRLNVVQTNLLHIIREETLAFGRQERNEQSHGRLVGQVSSRGTDGQ